MRLFSLILMMLIANPAQAQSGAILRGLDRLNGTVEDFEIAPGQVLTFGRLQITLDECRLREGSAEAHAYLQVSDIRQPADVLFKGWMFAASPAFAALDHPRYDVWVLNCKT